MAEVKVYAVIHGTWNGGTVLCLALDLASVKIADAVTKAIDQHLSGDAPIGLSVYEGTFVFSGDYSSFSEEGGCRELDAHESNVLFSFESPCDPGFAVVRELKPSLLCRTLGLQACYRCDNTACGDNQAKAPKEHSFELVRVQ